MDWLKAKTLNAARPTTGTPVNALNSAHAIGGGADGTVTTTVDLAGVAGDAYTVEVIEGASDSLPLAATILAGVIEVTLGTDGGAQSTADIGAGADGTVTTTVDLAGSAGDAYTVEVVAGVGLNVPLSAALLVKAITVTLGTDGAGALDATKNTATLVAGVITALLGVTAAASGTGADPLTAAEGPTAFTGGGVGFALDPALNTATLVAGAITALAGVTAAASGTGADPITAAEGPHTFAGGLDGTVAEAYAYQQDANFFYVPIAQNTVAGKNWRRADLTVVY